MKVGLKLNLSFYSIVGLMILTTILVFINLSTVEEKQSDALDNRVQQIQIVDDIRANLALVDSAAELQQEIGKFKV